MNDPNNRLTRSELALLLASLLVMVASFIALISGV